MTPRGRRADVPSHAPTSGAGGPDPWSLLLRNTVLHDVECEDGPAFHRVIAGFPAAGLIVLIALEASPALPVVRIAEEVRAAVASGALRVQDRDPFAADQPDAALTEKARDARDRRWGAVGPLVTRTDSAMFDPRERGPLVATAAKANETNPARIYDWCRLYWQGGCRVDALVPSYARCGAPGQIRVPGAAKRGARSASGRQDPEAAGVNVDARIARWLVAGAKQFHEDGGKPLSAAYLDTMGKYFAVGRERNAEGKLVPVLLPQHLRPTEQQFRYWYKRHRDLEASLKRKKGEGKFNLQDRPLLGSATDLATGPGSLYQIDATVGDVYLLTNALPPAILGRPVVYLVRDTWYGGMITGLHVALDGPNWMGASMALQNALMDKVEFCARFGITIEEADWPCHHKPEAVIGDRGEMLAGHADEVAKSFRTRIDNTAPRRGDLKSIVERGFKTLNDEVIHWLPGAVYHARENGDPDYRLDATLTLRAFWTLMIRQVLFYNKHHRVRGGLPAGFSTPDGGSPTPLALWNWGVRHRSGHLERVDPVWARVHLLPSAQARVTRRGLYLKGHGLFYTCPTAERERWFVEDPDRKGSWYVTLAYDPRDVGLVYLRDDGKRRHGLAEPCALLRDDRQYAGLTLQELVDQRKRRKAQDQRNDTDDDQAWVELQDENDALIGEERERRDRALGDGGRLRVAGIKEHRADERRALHREEARHPTGGAVLPDDASCAGAAPASPALPLLAMAPLAVATSTPATSSPGATVPVRAPRLTSMLARVRDRRLGAGPPASPATGSSPNGGSLERTPDA